MHFSKLINKKIIVQEAVKLFPMNDPVNDSTRVFASGWGETYDANESVECLPNICGGVDFSILDLEICEDSSHLQTDFY